MATIRTDRETTSPGRAGADSSEVCDQSAGPARRATPTPRQPERTGAPPDETQLRSDTSSPRARRRFRRSWLDAVVLLALLVGVGFARDPRGFLNSDVAPKLITVERMIAHRTLDADVGYWAQADDPEATLHPLAVDFTFRVGERRIISWTVLDLLVLLPLVALGGLRLALLLPMGSVVAAALAAGALARRIRQERTWGAELPRNAPPGNAPPGNASVERSGRIAFWAIGLGTPLLVYGMDIWEHAPAVALCAWALVLLHDVAIGRMQGDTPPRPGAPLMRRATGFGRPLVAGVLLGMAGALRTDAVLFGFVATAVAVGTDAFSAARRRAWGHLATTVGAGLAVAAGFAAATLGEALLEMRILGVWFRYAKTAGVTHNAVASSDGSRMNGVLDTLFSVNTASQGVLAGALVVIGLTIVVRLRAGASASSTRLRLVFGMTAMSPLVIAALRLPFGPLAGALVASPLVVVGLSARGRRTPSEVYLLSVGLLAAVAVLATMTAAAPRTWWGARYLLIPAFALAVVGAARIERLAKPARIAVVVTMATVSMLGVRWVHERTSSYGTYAARLVERGIPVVSTSTWLLREGGTATASQHWFTAASSSERQRAISLLIAAGAPCVAVIEAAGSPPVTYPGLDRSALRFTRVDRLRLQETILRAPSRSCPGAATP